MQACTNMMTKYPDWFQKNRNVMQHLCLDYSNPKDWGAENLVLRNVNIVSTWNIGRANAEQILNKLHKYEGGKSDFFEISRDGYTLLIPYGKKKIGLCPKEIDYSLDMMEDIEEDTTEVDDSDNEMPSSIIDLVQQNRTVTYDPQVEVDGKYVYKATVVRSLFGSNPLSKDHLRRVQGLSKFTESARANVSVDNSIMLGDPVLINVKNRLQIAQIKCIKKANKRSNY